MKLAALFLLFASLSADVERIMKRDGVPGAASVVVKDGRVIAAEAFGVASSESGTPVTTSTLFRLGSTTKLFVALAVLELADQGKLRLDQPVGELVPDLAPPLRRITVEQLLTHTAGLAEETPMNGPLEESALHQRVTGWTADALLAEPGEIFSYSSPGYALLGDVIAHVTKRPFSETMKTLVLDPMGMRDSTFLPLAAVTHPLALGHDKSGVIRPFPENAGNYPPGSLFTSADDLGRFFAALPPAKLERLAAKSVPIPAQDRRYGYGIVVDTRRGPRLLLHTGGRAGYGSTFVFLPSERVAVATLANRTTATLSPAALAAIEAYAPLRDVEAATTTLPLSRETIASIAGKYTNGAFAVELAADGDKLVVRVGGKSLPAVRVGNDRFHVDGGAQLETFVIVRDKAGAARFLCAETWALRKRS